MRARIVTTVALLSIAGLAMGPALAEEECPLHEQLLEQCPPAPPTPEPEPAPQPTPEPTPQPSIAPGHQPAAVTRLLTLLNAERQSRGLVAFALREDVSVQSRRHSETMAAGGTIWHNDGFFTVANKKRLGAVLLGENVARNVDIDDAHRRLMNSPGHRANVLDRRFTVIGLGVYRSATGSLYVTESFLQPPTAAAPRPAAERPAPSPAPVSQASTTTVPTGLPDAAPEPVVLAAGPSPELLLAPARLSRGTDAGSLPSPLLCAALLLVMAAAAVAFRHHRVFAPLLSRIRR